MATNKKINEPNGVYFITFTCAQWLPLFKITNAFSSVYKWFDVLNKAGHHIVGYVIMPNHIHILIAFCTSKKSINNIIGEGKRFLAYEIIRVLFLKNEHALLEKLSKEVRPSKKKINKKHQVFERSFDWKECYSINFMKQKVNYIHLNPCKKGLAKLPEDYLHSSAKYYFTGVQGIYPVITYMELQDIDLTKPELK
jgi:REP element-mobilizing transposase RayT